VEVEEGEDLVGCGLGVGGAPGMVIVRGRPGELVLPVPSLLLLLPFLLLLE